MFVERALRVDLVLLVERALRVDLVLLVERALRVDLVLLVERVLLRPELRGSKMPHKPFNNRNLLSLLLYRYKFGMYLLSSKYSISSWLNFESVSMPLSKKSNLISKYLRITSGTDA